MEKETWRWLKYKSYYGRSKKKTEEQKIEIACIVVYLFINCGKDYGYIWTSMRWFSFEKKLNSIDLL